MFANKSLVLLILTLGFAIPQENLSKYHRQSSGSRSFSSAGAGSFASAGGFGPGGFGQGFIGGASGPGYPGYFGGFPHPSHHFQPAPFDFAGLFQQYVEVLQQLQAIAAHAQKAYGYNPNAPRPSKPEINNVMTGATNVEDIPNMPEINAVLHNGPGDVPVMPGMPGMSSISGMPGDVGASASAVFGDDGGHGEVSVFEADTRIGSDEGPLSAPGNGPVTVFTSSSSGSSDINGKKTSYKTASVGSIDSTGKVTQYSVKA